MSNGSFGATKKKTANAETAEGVDPATNLGKVRVSTGDLECVITIGEISTSTSGETSVPVEVEMKPPEDEGGGPAVTGSPGGRLLPAVKIRAVASAGGAPVVVEMKSPGDDGGGPTVTIQVDA